MTAKPTETRSYENFIIRYSAHVTPYDYNANVARKKSDDDEGIRGAVSSTNRSIFDLNNTTCKCAKQCVVAWEYICRGVDTLFFYHSILFFFFWLQGLRGERKSLFRGQFNENLYSQMFINCLLYDK